MITREDLIYIGHASRTHGNQGVLQIVAENTHLEDSDPEHIFLLIDQLFVPFRLLDWRGKGADSLLLTLSGVEDEPSAARYVGCEVYMETRYAVNEDGEIELTLQDMAGYRVLNEEGQEVGVIKTVDESTMNALFEIEQPNGHTFYLPAHDDFVIDADYDQRVLTMIIPEGMTELN